MIKTEWSTKHESEN